MPWSTAGPGKCRCILAAAPACCGWRSGMMGLGSTRNGLDRARDWACSRCRSGRGPWAGSCRSHRPQAAEPGCACICRRRRRDERASGLLSCLPDLVALPTLRYNPPHLTQRVTTFGFKPKGGQIETTRVSSQTDFRPVRRAHPARAKWRAPPRRPVRSHSGWAGPWW